MGVYMQTKYAHFVLEIPQQTKQDVLYVYIFV
jgi:hypothetical protein